MRVTTSNKTEDNSEEADEQVRKALIKGVEQFGGEVLRGFSFALLIGVIVGTYSSIYLAIPVLLDSAKKDHAPVARRESSNAEKNLLKRQA